MIRARWSRAGTVIDTIDTIGRMGTTYSLRDLGINAGQAKQIELELELVPYVQGAIEYVDAGGEKGPVLGPKPPVSSGIEYEVAGGSVPAKLDVTAMTEGNSFRLRFAATYTGPCARCLEPASWSVEIDAHAVHDADTDEEELRSDHVDDQTNLLDVSAWAREEVGLLFPTRVLCRPDCRGLCAQCGENLNDNPDHGHEKPSDSRWDALKELALEDPESPPAET
ncbi:MAG: hypothetical protein JWM86_2529 [Thermoleophilia bacterium]|nr:hypothetical protein [Thermoleophilia bacterium]